MPEPPPTPPKGTLKCPHCGNTDPTLLEAQPDGTTVCLVCSRRSAR